MTAAEGCGAGWGAAGAAARTGAGWAAGQGRWRSWWRVVGCSWCNTGRPVWGGAAGANGGARSAQIKETSPRLGRPAGRTCVTTRGCLSGQRSWNQWVVGCPGAVDSQRCVVLPSNSTSNQAAMPCTVQGVPASSGGRWGGAGGRHTGDSQEGALLPDSVALGCLPMPGCCVHRQQCQGGCSGGAGAQGRRGAGAQGCRGAGVQGCRGAGVQGCSRAQA